MKPRFAIVLTLTLLACTAVAVAGDGAAEPLTLEGTLVCAKCKLNDPAFEECQNVLRVDGAGGGDAEYYYVVDNEIAESYGHVCGGEKDVVVTGTVETRDGRKWLTATKMVPPADA